MNTSIATAPYHHLWDARIGAWRVAVNQYGDTTPIVTATQIEPKYRFHQTLLEDPSKVRVAGWLEFLETAAGVKAG